MEHVDVDEVDDLTAERERREGGGEWERITTKAAVQERRICASYNHYTRLPNNLHLVCRNPFLDHLTCNIQKGGYRGLINNYM